VIARKKINTYRKYDKSHFTSYNWRAQDS